MSSSEARDVDKNDETTSQKEPVLLSCPTRGTTARASSILQKNSKLYGPKNVLKNDTSFWNSDSSSGEPSLVVDLKRLATITKINLEYQAGFAAEICKVFVFRNDQHELVEEWDTLDQHGMQTLVLETPQTTSSALKFVFDECTDFYGRVALYRVQVWGHEEEKEEKEETT